jgi:hypothetical protein
LWLLRCRGCTPSVTQLVKLGFIPSGKNLTTRLGDATLEPRGSLLKLTAVLDSQLLLVATNFFGRHPPKSFHAIALHAKAGDTEVLYRRVHKTGSFAANAGFRFHLVAPCLPCVRLLCV